MPHSIHLKAGVTALVIICALAAGMVLIKLTVGGLVATMCLVLLPTPILCTILVFANAMRAKHEAVTGKPSKEARFVVWVCFGLTCLYAVALAIAGLLWVSRQ